MQTPDAGRERMEKARRVFEQPQLYLRNDAHIGLRVRAVKELLGDPHGSMLDIGCGDGRVSRQFIGARVMLTLVDPAQAMLDLARDAIAPELRPGVSFVRSSVDDFEHTPFDVVLCLGVLAHVPDVDAALRKLVSLVAPGGRCVLQLTDHVEPSARLSDAFYRLKKRVRDISGYEVHKTSATDVLKRMQDLGMRPIGMRQYWVLPPLFGRLPVSLGRKLLAALYDSPQASAWGSEKIFAFEKRRSA